MHLREACPICDGYDAAVLDTHDRDERPVLTLLCRGCGLIRAEDGKPFSMPFKTPGRRRLWREGRAAGRLAAMLRGVLPVGAFGCDADAGCGVLMYVLKRAGYGIVGGASSAEAVLYARQALGSTPEAQTWNKLRCSDSSFDFMVLSNLDAEIDPMSSLLKAFTKLRSDGILCVSVPDATALLRCRQPGRRFSVRRPYTFSGMTLRAMAYKAGFLPMDEGESGTDVLFRKTHAPIPTRPVPLPDHAEFLMRCAQGHSGERWRRRVERLRLRRKAFVAAVSGFVSGASPGEIVIRALDRA